MKIVDDRARAAFNGPGHCELCGEWCGARDCHHAFQKKGMGGGSQIDVPENLAALHRVPCHHMAENYQEKNREVQRRVARRCGLHAGDILIAMRRIAALPKEAIAERDAILRTLRGDALLRGLGAGPDGHLPGGPGEVGPGVHPPDVADGEADGFRVRC